ncbi:signal peptide peptidase SppA [Nitrosophilus alvini]|uniref:signal peptide peptidase SppA n=1 Tax=Nitrosophilus alvini TaxID=2714855 RepID=UPI00190D8E8D|nr:signal peptide peptidase SppA [Nitrosophilus alvini]
MIDFFKKLFYPIKAVLDFIQKYFKALLFVLILVLIFGTPKGETLQKPNLIRVDLTGPIFSADKVLQKLEEAEKPNYKGVLFVVNSPGGAVAPSIEISLAIKRIRRQKPVVVYAAGTIASGSYYASIWADKIIANPGSAVGSIGVIFEGANIKKLIEKIGIEPQVVKAGKYKEVGTPFREWQEFEKKELEKVIKDTYDMFVSDVAKARKLDLGKRDEFANAHIFTARQAIKVGLIDKIGTLYDAKQEITALSGVAYPVWKKEDRFEKFMEKIIEESASKISMMLFGFKASI